MSYVLEMARVEEKKNALSSSEADYLQRLSRQVGAFERFTLSAASGASNTWLIHSCLSELRTKT